MNNHSHLGFRDFGIPGLGGNISGTRDLLNKIQGFESHPGPGFQGMEFRVPGSVTKFRHPGIHVTYGARISVKSDGILDSDI